MKIRAVLINPRSADIVETMVDKVDLEDMFRQLTFDGQPKVDDINTVILNQERTEVLWVDGEGLMKKPQWFFKIGFYPEPLAGIGIVTGIRGDGMAPTRLTPDKLRKVVSFFAPERQPEVLGFDDSFREVEHPLLGKSGLFERKTKWKEPTK